MSEVLVILGNGAEGDRALGIAGDVCGGYVSNGWSEYVLLKVKILNLQLVEGNK